MKFYYFFRVKSTFAIGIPTEVVFYNIKRPAGGVAKKLSCKNTLIGMPMA